VTRDALCPTFVPDLEHDALQARRHFDATWWLDRCQFFGAAIQPCGVQLVKDPALLFYRRHVLQGIYPDFRRCRIPKLCDIGTGFKAVDEAASFFLPCEQYRFNT
jgi:hypothetical protein